MPIGSMCRTCGAKLSGDVAWCARCLTPISPHSRREPLHDAATFVGSPVPTPRTSRWRAGATAFGPFGRIAITVVVLALFPWGLLGGGLSAAMALQLWFMMGWVLMATFVLRHVWRRERIADDAPPSAVERFSERHPTLGRAIRLGSGTRIALVVVAAACAIAAWTGLGEVDRYVLAVAAIVAGVGIFLASWNDL